MILIKNGYIVTMDPKRRVYKDGFVVINDSRIEEIGETKDIGNRYKDAKVIDAKDKVVLPGLIDAHTHLYQVLYRGLGDDMPLAEWLMKCIWPLSRYLGREESYMGALLASLEMLKTGTTTFADSHYINIDKGCHDGIAQAIDEIGIRGVLGRATVDSSPAPEIFRESIDEAQIGAAAVIEKHHGSANGRITVRVEPLNETLASKDMIKAMWDIAKQYNVGMNMHLAETSGRVQSSRDKYGLSSIEFLNSIGVLGPNLLLAHCVWISKKEIYLLSSTDTKVVHNSVSNQYLADGIAPIPELIRNGVTVTIGADGACSNNNLDMFGAMKAAALLHKVNEMNPLALTAEKVLEMATIDAAKSLGMDDEIGSLEVGKKADIILVDSNRADMTPNYSKISNLVYATTGDAVDTVLVDGKIVMDNRNIVNMEEQQILDRANNIVGDMLTKSNSWNLVNRGNWLYIK